jgi:hypothetical protein
VLRARCHWGEEPWSKHFSGGRTWPPASSGRALFQDTLAKATATQALLTGRLVLQAVEQDVGYFSERLACSESGGPEQPARLHAVDRENHQF